jgi:hypothetical protein
MRKLFLLAFIITLVSVSSFGQTKKGSNVGKTPKVSIYKVVKDSLAPLASFASNKETRIKVVLEGGMENVNHSLYVTSKNAVIKKDPSTKDEYLITPQDETCEIIVDVKTYEVYFSVIEKEVNGKKKKEKKEYPPKTYMLGYEKYPVK